MVPRSIMIWSTSSGPRDVSSPRRSAAMPATCGQAIEVPLMWRDPVLLSCCADSMYVPGAKMSTHSPSLLYQERVSVLAVAATVMALPTKAGECLQASGQSVDPSLPAATTTVTPPATALSMATLTDAMTALAPKLALKTAGFMLASCVACRTQSNAPMNHEKEPTPLSLRTLTAWTTAFFATPYWVPAMIPAVWVPCPPMSLAQLTSLRLHTRGDVNERTSSVGMARPPKSVCSVIMPVSATKTCTPSPSL
mmetsp:Transcript_31031/g.84128  ORF Transcript_31031/g.84128 Transcript_31031/m.84128 type:complete len:252 (-) Transcript_31031:236-991(-)